MDVTSRPHDFNKVPNDEAMTPLPTPLITPPVTKMYFILDALEMYNYKRSRINQLTLSEKINNKYFSRGGKRHMYVHFEAAEDFN